MSFHLLRSLISFSIRFYSCQQCVSFTLYVKFTVSFSDAIVNETVTFIFGFFIESDRQTIDFCILVSCNFAEPIYSNILEDSLGLSIYTIMSSSK